MATETKQASGGAYVTVVSHEQLCRMLSAETKPTAGMDCILERRRERIARG